MSRYIAIIDDLKKFTVTDPYYKRDVFCRYSNSFNIKGNWNMELVTHTDDENTLFFGMVLFPNSKIEFKHYYNIQDNALVGIHKVLDKNKTDIGMDVAQICFGINEYADEINNNIGSYHPPFAIPTFTDGFFGNVTEVYTPKKELLGITFEGYFLENTIKENDFLEYINDQLKLKEIIKIDDKEIGVQ